jgi:toxin HigB-1
MCKRPDCGNSVCSTGREVLKICACRLPPGNRLEQLKGDRKGQWSIRVNEQWRLCFVWRNGDAHEIEIVDYH